MTIPIGRSAGMTVKTLESPPCLWISKKTIWTTRRRFIHLHQVRNDEIIQTTRVSQPKKRSRAETVLARTAIPNLWHPPRAIAPLLLKFQKSTINTVRKSDVVPAQALPLPKADGDLHIPQPKASGDYNISQHQKATYGEAKQFIDAIVFAKTPLPIISDEKYFMVHESWKLMIQTQDCQQPLAGALVGTPSVCQLPIDPSFKINPQSREDKSVYFVCCSSIGLILIRNPRTIHCQN